MSRTVDLLGGHLQKHPAAQVQDAAKFLYQALYGSGHLVADPRAVEDYLQEEADGLPLERRVPLFEPLGQYVRMDLGALKMLSIETMAAMFIASAADEPEERTELAAALDEMVSKGLFDDEKSLAWIAEYKEQGCPAVHHSENYRAVSGPAYRVVKEEYAKFFEAFLLIDRLLSGGGSATVAIDGMCGSGKTTLAALMQSVYDCTVFHADDFYLPPELRTPERYATPGGNVHWERILKEVLRPLRLGRTVLYRPFDCETMALVPKGTRIRPTRLAILEGSYSTHPQLRGAYDLKIFLKTTPAKQEERILKRNGPEKLQMFKEKWIPLENLFFDALDVQSNCDLVFET